MSIQNKTKDHIKGHGGIELVEPVLAPKSSDPLRFWTDHPTENCPVDLRVFAAGESTNPGRARWVGAFSGRPELIHQMAPAIKARLTLAAPGTCRSYTFALRTIWRVFDQMESIVGPDGQSVRRLTSVEHLTHLHEAAAHNAAIGTKQFAIALTLFNDARHLLRLGSLWWTIPSYGEPSRQLLPEDQAKALRIAIKRDWQRVQLVWERHDAIRRGEDPDTLDAMEKQNAGVVDLYVAQNQLLAANWRHFADIQRGTGRILPTTEQVFEGSDRAFHKYHSGIDITTMRAIAFPTVEEADIAFHMSLAGCGWNPSTLLSGVDASLPERVFIHPKDPNQHVLVVEGQDEGTGEEEEVAMQGVKRRAGGRLQFCMGLKKNPASPPNIVAKYIERTQGLRRQLRMDCEEARNRLASLTSSAAPQADIERQFLRYQTLQQGLRNVWLYVEHSGQINWLDGKRWVRYGSVAAGKKLSYLDTVIERLNIERVKRNEPLIARIVPSDFRDLFARWVHIQSGGNVIAVMHALGHAGLRSTDGYLNNNIFDAENDEAVHRFMTHLFSELGKGRIDLTILAQLVRNGPLTEEMHKRLKEYRGLMRSRIKVACADVKHPPAHIAPEHQEGKWCGPQCCLRKCHNARFLPESLDGIAMRVEELLVMSSHLPLATWRGNGFEIELASGEYLLDDLFKMTDVESARSYWRDKIASGEHVIPGFGFIPSKD